MVRSIVKILMIIIGVLNGFDAVCQSDIWVVNKKNGKEFLLPKENNQTFFRVLPNKIKLDHDKIANGQNIKFPIDSGFIGSPYEYKYVSNDSIALELPTLWENSLTKYNMQYKIAVSDITEIHVQRTYNKASEQVWIWGGVLGAVSLISAPIYYFTDNKKLGVGWFALGISSMSASIVSYKIHIGYKKFKKPYSEFLVK